MARVHWLSSNTAYGRNDLFERRLASSRRLFDEEGIRPYLVEEDGETVGVLTVGDDELYAIYVHPDWWGTGAGQLLMDCALELLAETCEVAVHFGGEPTDVAKYRKRFVQVPGT